MKCPTLLAVFLFALLQPSSAAAWARWTDFAVAGEVNAATGTLAECKAKCSDGTWAGCIGFAR